MCNRVGTQLLPRKLGEPLLEPVGEAADALIAGVDDDVSDFPVQRIALGEERRQLRKRVLSLKERAVAVVARAVVKVVRRCAEVDDGAVLRENPAIFLREDGAPTGCENDLGRSRQLREDPAFACSEARFAFDLDYDRDANAGCALDLVIGIVKRLAEPARQQFTDRGFARAHQTHEEDVSPERVGITGAVARHAAILTESHRRLQCPLSGECSPPALEHVY